MIEKDTVRLLRECDAGAKMGISSIDDVLQYAKGKDIKDALESCKDEHKKLAVEITNMLDRYGDDGKDPAMIAQGMSHMKSAAMMMAGGNDATIADLMTDGCNMGVKSLSRYLNQYKAADEKSKDIAKRLIDSEQRLCDGVRAYL